MALIAAAKEYASSAPKKVTKSLCSSLLTLMSETMARLPRAIASRVAPPGATLKKGRLHQGHRFLQNPDLVQFVNVPEKADVGRDSELVDSLLKVIEELGVSQILGVAGAEYTNVCKLRVTPKLLEGLERGHM